MRCGFAILASLACRPYERSPPWRESKGHDMM